MSDLKLIGCRGDGAKDKVKNTREKANARTDDNGGNVERAIIKSGRRRHGSSRWKNHDCRKNAEERSKKKRGKGGGEKKKRESKIARGTGRTHCGQKGKTTA